jgi:hypothetical protein
LLHQCIHNGFGLIYFKEDLTGPEYAHSREWTRQQIMIPGTRPVGTFIAGTAQRYVNIEGYLPSKK